MNLKQTISKIQKPKKTHVEGETRDYIIDKYTTSSNLTRHVLLYSLIVINTILTKTLKLKGKNYIKIKE